MPPKIIFNESLLVSGIMCFDGCGNLVKGFISDYIQECTDNNKLPHDAELSLYAEPHGIGIHRLFISIHSQQEGYSLPSDFRDELVKAIPMDIINDPDQIHTQKTNWTNRLNILINLFGMSIVIICALIFPPSMVLTAGLGVISFVTTAFTSRDYLIAFFRNIKTKQFANMATTISLGWFLSLGHALYHSISMPMISSFSMLFMNFIMPITLITCINAMDEIKRLVMEQSRKIQLKGLGLLFPKMSEQYSCYELSEHQLEHLAALKEEINKYQEQEQENPLAALVLSTSAKDSTLKGLSELNTPQEIAAPNATIIKVPKNLLKAHMLIKVNAGECFPVDCILVKGITVIDASLLTGEAYHSKKLWEPIPAGAVNLGQPVTVYATKSPYDSTVNSLLFRSNRAKDSNDTKASPGKFAYFYTALVLLGLIVAAAAPVALGVASVPLIIQNIIGILFSLCPCTIAIGHELPKLLSMHQRNQKGVHLRDDSLTDTGSHEIHTVVFDKTGTLTTGNSVVESFDEALDSGLWQRIYLLEKEYGQGHPLAKAIQKHYEDQCTQPLLNNVGDYCPDELNRGFSGTAQGKTLHIGSADYLQRKGIPIPPLSQSKMQEGCSAVYIAEGGNFKGVIYIKHEVRTGAKEALARLKREGKKIIMLTGDSHTSARGFNMQMGDVFNEEDIFAGQTPADKESFLEKIKNPHRVWFCGDGLNDAPSCRMISERGGVSCAMNASDNSAFFTDISLNGSFDYLFKHHQLNHSLQERITQNKGILVHSTLALLAFIISFSIVGVGVSPLIPMAIMLSMTLLVLFNSYRVPLSIDCALDKKSSWSKKLLSSNLSIGLLLGASTLLIAGVLVATIATGGLALPLIAFTAGAAAAFSSVCALSAIALLSAFILLLTSSLLSKKGQNPKAGEEATAAVNQSALYRPSPSQPPEAAHQSLQPKDRAGHASFVHPTIICPESPITFHAGSSP